MKEQSNRRRFIKQSLQAAAGMTVAGLPAEIIARDLRSERSIESKVKMKTIISPAQTLRFSVIGINHGHIHSQIGALVRNGGQLVSFYAKEPDLASAFSKRYPHAKLAGSEKEILEDSSIQLIVSASIPLDRAPLGIQAMRHGKDFMVDKPGIITLKQLEEVRKVQAETKRIYSIMYSERLENRSTTRAGALVKAGAIGKVIQTIGLGPHRMSTASRPEWFFDRKYFGGILCDIASHQFDQFLYFTGSKKAEVVSSQVGNVNHAQYPLFEDFGDVMLRGDGGMGYVRVDWFTPDGLNTWGDGRLTILGTEGYIELRKYTDVAGREGGDHLFLVDGKQTRYFDCKDEPLPYGEQLIYDIINRTETAMSQEHCFLATELALKAQQQAKKIELKG
jgi:predicted dehydrogenase